MRTQQEGTFCTTGREPSPETRLARTLAWTSPTRLEQIHFCFFRHPVCGSPSSLSAVSVVSSVYLEAVDISPGNPDSDMQMIPV